MLRRFFMPYSVTLDKTHAKMTEVIESCIVMPVVIKQWTA